MKKPQGADRIEEVIAAMRKGRMVIMTDDAQYGTTVRVVDIGGFSKELCGGTHVRSTGKIGAIRIVGESAIAAAGSALAKDKK